MAATEGMYLVQVLNKMDEELIPHKLNSERLFQLNEAIFNLSETETVDPDLALRISKIMRNVHRLWRSGEYLDNDNCFCYDYLALLATLQNQPHFTTPQTDEFIVYIREAAANHGSGTGSSSLGGSKRGNLDDARYEKEAWKGEGKGKNKGKGRQGKAWATDWEEEEEDDLGDDGYAYEWRAKGKGKSVPTKGKSREGKGGGAVYLEDASTNKGKGQAVAAAAAAGKGKGKGQKGKAAAVREKYRDWEADYWGEWVEPQTKSKKQKEWDNAWAWEWGEWDWSAGGYGSQWDYDYDYDYEEDEEESKPSGKDGEKGKGKGKKESGAA
eukprot:CAMPEP_0206575992 /NCGR_PEP_ID=MMETSP0325_2-20121206/30450_1 /ASSEMBLY_ACC=CAM_ASM_000347 /TAXON_ID=2866 /ORGANISM="Crypthecodinium cohnii, Strain Seligo" /LENGTH=325 /DNA_ID=CAMNT_0054081051 /DNA_START=113 /DNA_END=1087 /DNA_ORIENTATION=+